MDISIIKSSRQKLTYFGVSFLVASVLPLIALSRKYLFFQNNDDIFILGRASGIFYGEPSSELIYVSPPLSTSLELLYRLSQDYSWYTILLLITQFLSIFGYLLIFQDQVMALSKPKGAALMFLVSAPVFAFFILFFSLQFTQTGIMAAGLGSLLFIFGKGKFNKVFGLIMVSLGILWRSDGSLVVIAFVFGFVILYKIIHSEWQDIFKFLKTLLPVVVVSIFSYASYALTFNDWAPWISQDKKEYVELKNVFTQLYGFESTATSYADLEIPAKAAGFTDNDWDLYKKYYFLDNKVFGVEVQEEIARNRIQQSYPVFLSLTFENLNNLLTNRYKSELQLSLILSAIIILFATKFRLRLYFGFWIFLYLAYFGVLLLGERLPERVFWPFTLVAVSTLVAAIIMNGDEQIFKKIISFRPVNYELVILVVLIILIFPLSNNLFVIYQNKIDSQLWWKVAPEQKILNIDKVYYYEPDKPVVAFFSFYENFRKTMDPMQGPSSLPAIWNNLIFIGWENKTPEFNKRLKDYGLAQDLFTSIATGDAYLATWTNPSDNFEVNNGSIFLREHKNIDVIWEPEPLVFSDSGLAIWRAEDFVVIK
jgi:hypothetical protein